MSEDEDWRSEAAYDYIDKLTPGVLLGSSCVVTPIIGTHTVTW